MKLIKMTCLGLKIIYTQFKFQQIIEELRAFICFLAKTTMDIVSTDGSVRKTHLRVHFGKTLKATYC